MIYLQLSAGQGPEECCIAVERALGVLLQSCERDGVGGRLVAEERPKSCRGYRSVLIELQGTGAGRLADSWQGTMLWRCTSPVRPKHKRKNWFFSGAVFGVDDSPLDGDIEFRTCRASGAGGQHVNRTESAVQARHTATGIDVRVESERSQHANKRLAVALIRQKLMELEMQRRNEQRAERHRQHRHLERGNPARTFVGPDFKPS